jgi:hypothetical protein
VYYEEREVVREPLRREYYEKQETLLSIRVEDARRRRRRERNAPTIALWEALYVIYPTGNEDVIVVTERYEYRLKK